MTAPIHRLPIFAVLLVVLLPLLAPTADDAAAPHFLEYSVSNGVVTIISAVTPYDSSPRVRDSFLHWFKRGFETTWAGKAPLMISWNDTAEGQAGRKGYDLGVDEAERSLKKGKEFNQPQQSTTIPPGL